MLKLVMLLMFVTGQRGQSFFFFVKVKTERDVKIIYQRKYCSQVLLFSLTAILSSPNWKRVHQAVPQDCSRTVLCVNS